MANRVRSSLSITGPQRKAFVDALTSAHQTALNALEFEVKEDGEALRVFIETAWNPPGGAIEQITARFPDVSIALHVTDDMMNIFQVRRYAAGRWQVDDQTAQIAEALRFPGSNRVSIDEHGNFVVTSDGQPHVDQVMKAYDVDESTYGQLQHTYDFLDSVHYSLGKMLETYSRERVEFAMASSAEDQEAITQAAERAFKYAADLQVVISGLDHTMRLSHAAPIEDDPDDDLLF